jgi:predicted site-specific integrase-resolvase
MTVEEVAPLFTKSPKTIYRWASSGKLPVAHDPAGGVQFERSRIMQIIELMAKDLLR